MIVCHCRVVSDRSVEAAISAGNRTVSSVCRATGAGQDCAGCVFTLKAMVCAHHAQEQAVVAAEGAAS